MSKGGFRLNSGRKKGSIPWNKGIKSGNHGNGFKKGQIAWNKDAPMSNESKLKMSLSRKGKPSPWKGKSPNAATRLKMSLAKKGKPSGRKGIKLSEEWKEKMSKSKRDLLLRANPNYDYRLDSKTRIGNKRIRRERLKQFGGSHTKSEWEKLKNRYNLICPSCKKQEPEIKLTRDHVVPLSSKGTDDITNIQPLCVKCNSKKYTQSIRY